MISEIGSEFWTGSTTADGFGIAGFEPENFDTRLVLSGRTALDIIISDIRKSHKAGKVYLPSYCCHTMIEPFIRHGIECRFYSVTVSAEGQNCGFEENDCEIIYLMEYFGYRDERVAEFAKSQKKLGKIVICDATHSLFCKNADLSAYDYWFASCKKWFNVNAALCCKRKMWNDFPSLGQNAAFADKRSQAFDLKAEYKENHDNSLKEQFLPMFNEAEELLEQDYREYAPDPRSVELLKSVNIEKMAEKRRRNASILIENLKDCGWVELFFKKVGEFDTPLFVPVSVHCSRNELRRYLIQNSIYLPVHWPVSEIHQLSDKTRKIYDEELSLVCDQRYSEEDMMRISDEIKRFFNA